MIQETSVSCEKHFLVICLYKLILQHRDCGPVSLFGTCPVVFIYLDPLDIPPLCGSPGPQRSPKVSSSLGSLQAAWRAFMGSPHLIPSHGHRPEWPDLCGQRIILPFISVTPDRRKDPVSPHSPAPPEVEVSYF